LPEIAASAVALALALLHAIAEFRGGSALTFIGQNYGVPLSDCGAEPVPQVRR
jgi:hypothetical protein